MSDRAPVYIAAKAHPWDADTVTTDPTRAAPNHPKPIGVLAPTEETGGAFVMVPPGKFMVGRMMLTPSRWLPPFRYTAAPMGENDREAFVQALRTMAFGSCVLPPSVTLEIVEPAAPPRAFLARTALGLVLPRSSVPSRVATWRVFQSVGEPIGSRAAWDAAVVPR